MRMGRRRDGRESEGMGMAMLMRMPGDCLCWVCEIVSLGRLSFFFGGRGRIVDLSFLYSKYCAPEDEFFFVIGVR